MKWYLDKVECTKNVKKHTTPLPLDFVPMTDDNSATDEAAAALSTAYNLDSSSWTGALLYLALTQTDIIHAVNKIAKYTRKPGKVHFKALVHI